MVAPPTVGEVAQLAEMVQQAHADPVIAAYNGYYVAQLMTRIVCVDKHVHQLVKLLARRVRSVMLTDPHATTDGNALILAPAVWLCSAFLALLVCLECKQDPDDIPGDMTDVRGNLPPLHRLADAAVLIQGKCPYTWAILRKKHLRHSAVANDMTAPLEDRAVAAQLARYWGGMTVNESRPPGIFLQQYGGALKLLDPFNLFAGLIADDPPDHVVLSSGSEDMLGCLTSENGEIVSSAALGIGPIELALLIDCHDNDTRAKKLAGDVNGRLAARQGLLRYLSEPLAARLDEVGTAVVRLNKARVTAAARLSRVRSATSQLDEVGTSQPEQPTEQKSEVTLAAARLDELMSSAAVEPLPKKFPNNTLVDDCRFEMMDPDGPATLGQIARVTQATVTTLQPVAMMCLVLLGINMEEDRPILEVLQDPATYDRVLGDETFRTRNIEVARMMADAEHASVDAGRPFIAYLFGAAPEPVVDDEETDRLGQKCFEVM